MTRPYTLRQALGEFAAERTAEEWHMAITALLAFGQHTAAEFLAQADAVIRAAEDAAGGAR